MRPEVSVIMYVKNGMPYFERALQSVITQTLHNLEILVIDGGSTDGTIEYTKQCQYSDSRIRLLHSAQGSVGAQFNMGVRESKGKYIGIVESDDYILPKMYEEELNCAEKNDCDVLRADNFIFFGSGDNEIRLRTKVSHNLSNYNRTISASREPENVLIGGSFWTGLYRRKFLIEKNIQMNETPGAAYQDFGFMFLTNVLADRVYIMSDAFYCYRKDNPVSSCNRPARLDMPIQEYCLLEKEMKQRSIWEQYREHFFLWKIRNERWFYFNLDEAVKKNYVHLLYEDIKITMKQFFSGMLLHDKEREFLDIADRGEKELYEYLKKKDQMWTESCKKIDSLKEGFVYLFGAGNIGRIFCYFLKNKARVRMQSERQLMLVYVDNASGLWGTELDGIPVISPQEALRNKEESFIVCSENYSGEIYAQLIKAGVSDQKIAVCDDMDSCLRLVMKEKKRT